MFWRKKKDSSKEVEIIEKVVLKKMVETINAHTKRISELQEVVAQLQEVTGNTVDMVKSVAHHVGKKI